MSIGEIHVGDTNSQFLFTVRDQNNNIVDLSIFSTTTLIFTRPDKTKLTVLPSFVTNGKDGQLQYFTTSTDLNLAGIWKYQITVANVTSFFNSDVNEFRVFPNS